MMLINGFAPDVVLEDPENFNINSIIDHPVQ